jgi:predicted DNA-binding transcriptional regulator AlpA
MLHPADDRLLSQPQVQQRYGVSQMAVWRWRNDPGLGFPQGIQISGRWYWHLSALQEFERACAGRAAPCSAGMPKGARGRRGRVR